MIQTGTRRERKERRAYEKSREKKRTYDAKGVSVSHSFRRFDIPPPPCTTAIQKQNDEKQRAEKRLLDGSLLEVKARLCEMFGPTVVESPGLLAYAQACSRILFSQDGEAPLMDILRWIRETGTPWRRLTSLEQVRDLAEVLRESYHALARATRENKNRGDYEARCRASLSESEVQLREQWLGMKKRKLQLPRF